MQAGRQGALGGGGGHLSAQRQLCVVTPVSGLSAVTALVDRPAGHHPWSPETRHVLLEVEQKAKGATNWSPS